MYFNSQFSLIIQSPDSPHKLPQLGVVLSSEGILPILFMHRSTQIRQRTSFSIRGWPANDVWADRGRLQTQRRPTRKNQRRREAKWCTATIMPQMWRAPRQTLSVPNLDGRWWVFFASLKIPRQWVAACWRTRIVNDSSCKFGQWQRWNWDNSCPCSAHFGRQCSIRPLRLKGMVTTQVCALPVLISVALSALKQFSSDVPQQAMCWWRQL